MEATRRISAKETNSSVCGPDQMKIGTDMAVNLGRVMMPSTGLTAVMPPQVIPVAEMNKHEITTNDLNFAEKHFKCSKPDTVGHHQKCLVILGVHVLSLWVVKSLGAGGAAVLASVLFPQTDALHHENTSMNK